MNRRLVTVAVLLLCSGGCALVYQLAWFREFQLIFGGSTPATAAVLAVFMGGLGLGNAVLGGRADRWSRPLAGYGALELSIAVLAASSPLLTILAKAAYVALGGQTALGTVAATGVRLALAVLVLGPPAVLMGGTFPAAARATTAPDDVHRRAAAVLYGTNTLGAVVGALLGTFVLLPALGTRATLWSAAMLNAVVGVVALRLARAPRFTPSESPGKPALAPPRRRSSAAAAANDESPAATVPARFVYAAAGIVGFVFFLMELVWYRLLGAILGGTTYTFGLILVVALLGIGVGGLAHAAFARRFAPSVGGFALSCALEALALAVPLALGDRLALLAHRFHQAGQGFAETVAGWSVVAAIAILPAAVIAGFQFPLMISLLGRADRDIGKQVGLAYAFNTFGAIAGSLAGGFGLLPWLGAPGAWRLSVALLVLLAGAATWMRFGRSRRAATAVAPLGTALAAALLLAAEGPTAAWRHGGIGVGRSSLSDTSRNGWRRFVHETRRAVVWEREGREAAIALVATDGLAFHINGKCDGNATSDVGTQVMLGMLGALAHDKPESSLVIGLGTGETAGWLAALPACRRVDVVELEPAIAEVARRCAPLNHNVLDHPKARLIFNDAREVLLTTPDRYDLIVSEPSNPYRPGVANLFTHEFYRAARDRLRPRGLFVQWLQGYEIDRQTIDDVVVTLDSVFGHVELWESKRDDMLLLCAVEPIAYDLDAMRRRAAAEPYRTALRWAWRAEDVESCLARFVAGADWVRAVKQRGTARINTDDRNLLEYRFARRLGSLRDDPMIELRREAAALGADRPIVGRGAADWDAVEGHRQLLRSTAERIWLPTRPAPVHRQRAEMLRRYWMADTAGTTRTWEAAGYEPLFPDETAILALAYADQGDARARPLCDRLARFQPSDARAIEAYLFWKQGKPAQSAEALVAAMTLLRAEPWGFEHATQLVFPTLLEVAARDRAAAARLLPAIDAPLALYVLEPQRLDALWRVADRLGPETLVAVLPRYEPYVPWDDVFLRCRARAYRAVNHPLADQARRDLDRFLRWDEPAR